MPKLKFKYSNFLYYHISVIHISYFITLYKWKETLYIIYIIAELYPHFHKLLFPLLLLAIGTGFILAFNIEENPIFSMKFNTCFAKNWIKLIKKLKKKLKKINNFTESVSFFKGIRVNYSFNNIFLCFVISNFDHFLDNVVSVFVLYHG